MPTHPQVQWGHSFDPLSRNIPHAVGQLSPFTTTTEPTRPEPGLCNRRSRRRETREEPLHPDQSQRAANQPSQKKKKKNPRKWLPLECGGRNRLRKDLGNFKKKGKRTRSPVDPSVPILQENRSLTPPRPQRRCSACPAARADIPLLPPAASCSCPLGAHVDGVGGDPTSHPLGGCHRGP